MYLVSFRAYISPLSEQIAFYSRFTAHSLSLTPRLNTFIKRLPRNTEMNVTGRSPADGISAILLARRTFTINFRSIHLSCTAPSTIPAHIIPPQLAGHTKASFYPIARVRSYMYVHIIRTCCSKNKVSCIVLSRFWKRRPFREHRWRSIILLPRSVYTIATTVNINRQLLWLVN